MRVFKSKETALAWGAAAVAMVRSLQVCVSPVMRVPTRTESPSLLLHCSTVVMDSMMVRRILVQQVDRVGSSLCTSETPDHNALRLIREATTLCSVR